MRHSVLLLIDFCVPWTVCAQLQPASPFDDNDDDDDDDDDDYNYYYNEFELNFIVYGL